MPDIRTGKRRTSPRRRIANPDAFMTVSEIPLPPEMQFIANDVFQMFKAATYRTFMGYPQPRGESFEKIIKKLIANTDRRINGRAKRRVLAQTRTQALKKRFLKSYASVNLRNADAIYKNKSRTYKASATKVADRIKRDPNYVFKHIYRQFDVPYVDYSRLSSDRVVMPYPYDYVSLKLEKVKCIIDCDGWGADEILIGGLIINESGKMFVLDSFKVGDFEEIGDERRYSPPKQLTKFKLRQGADVWPKFYTVMVAMAEEDIAGFHEFLVILYIYLRDYVSEQFVDLVASNVGGAMTQLLAIFNIIIANIVAAILLLVFGWLFELWKDDWIGIQSLACYQSTPYSDFGGSANSGTLQEMYTGDGGKYSVDFNWQFS